VFKKLRSSLAAIGQNWKMTQEVYRLLPLEVLGFFLAGFAVAAVPIGIFLNWPTGIMLGIPFGLLGAVFWFGRRAMRAAYSRIEGQPGAAAAVIGSMRGGWTVTPAVSVNRSQDVISRVVGKPGVILIAEGPTSRVQHMLASERKKTARWVPEVPIYEVQVGVEDGQVRLTKLQKTLSKLPRNLRGAEVVETRRRLEAVGNVAKSMPIPKGPVPTSARHMRRMR
jgi:hypothetical protein